MFKLNFRHKIIRLKAGKTPMLVLIADDTKNIRLLLTKCLNLQGYAVETADDGKTALEMMCQKNYDLIFLDIKMPMLSGTEVLRKMRETGLETPVIIITAYATVKNAVDCTHLGAVAYLQKPFTVDKIKAVLDELLGKYAQKNSSELIIEKAKAYIESGNFQRAILLLRGESALHPFEPEIYSLLSSACLALGKQDDAQRYRRLHDALL